MLRSFCVSMLLTVWLSSMNGSALTINSISRGKLPLATSTAPRTAVFRIMPPSRSVAMHVKKGGGPSGGEDFMRSISASLPGPGTLLFWSTLLLFPGFFFGLISNFLTALVVVPLLAFAGFQLWYSLTVQEAACQACGAEVVGFKNGDPFNCVSCGELLAAEVGATPPSWTYQTIFPADDDNQDGGSVFGGNDKASSGGMGQPPPKKSSSEPTGFVDVEIM